MPITVQARKLICCMFVYFNAAQRDCDWYSQQRLADDTLALQNTEVMQMKSTAPKRLLLLLLLQLFLLLLLAFSDDESRLRAMHKRLAHLISTPTYSIHASPKHTYKSTSCPLANANVARTRFYSIWASAGRPTGRPTDPYISLTIGIWLCVIPGGDTAPVCKPTF